MSRYIDVDKFIRDISIDYIYAMETGAETWCELPKTYPPNATQIAIELIRRADSADVIPVEWLEEKYKDLEYSYSFGATDELKSRMDGIRYAINLWRKENESNSNM